MEHLQVNCAIRLERLQQWLGNLLPVMRIEPVAVWRDDQTFFYLVDPQWLHARLGSRAPDAPAQPQDRKPVTAGPNLPERPQETAERSAPTVADAARRLLAQESERVDRGAYTAASLQIMRNRLRLHILPELGERPLAAVQTEQLDALLRRLMQHKASATTLSQYLVIMRKLLKLALSKKWISEMPEMPRIAIHNRPRAAFSVGQYRQLLRKARELTRLEIEAPRIKQGEGLRERFWVSSRYRTLPMDMYWLMVFMVNSFVRPSDVKNIQHQHVEVVRGRHTYLRLNLPASKKHDKPVVSLQPAVRIYEQLLARARHLGQAKPNDYLFLPQESNREHALAILNFWLKWILREAGIALTDSHGQMRTLYCLRHTAITFRLLYGQGIDMLTLARNARTSVEMIETFYASSLSGEMNVAMLQSRRT